MTRIQANRFTPSAVQIIQNSLPEPLNPRQRSLLPEIFYEWDRTELQDHLSRQSRPAINARIRQLQTVQIKANELSQAIAALDERALLAMLAQLNTDAASKDGSSRSVERLNEICEIIDPLAKLTPNQFWKSGRGRPRNLTAYLVLQDAAAIYEWWSDQKAARGVDRIKGHESGPFFRFVSTLWPLIFGEDTKGLPAAMKNWARARNKLNERSALIANLNFRHPAWRLFER